MKKLIFHIAVAIFTIIFVAICIVIGFRSCLVIESPTQYVSWNQEILNEINKAKENLSEEELNKVDEIWFEANDILESHMNEEEIGIWIEWQLSPPRNDEEINKYTDFYNSIWKRLSEDEKNNIYEVENKLKQLIGTKTLLNKMMRGVDAVKIIIYKLACSDLLEQFDDEEFSKNMAGTIVNEIFDDHLDETKERFESNKEVVLEEIKNLGESYPDLKQAVTDAVRIFFTVKFWMGSEKMGDVHYIRHYFDKAFERGIFLRGGDEPNPGVFFDRIQRLAIKYEVIEIFNYVPFEYKWEFILDNIPLKENDASAYCPKCGTQYREGFDICADCEIELAKF